MHSDQFTDRPIYSRVVALATPVLVLCTTNCIRGRHEENGDEKLPKLRHAQKYVNLWPSTKRVPLSLLQASRADLESLFLGYFRKCHVFNISGNCTLVK